MEIDSKRLVENFLHLKASGNLAELQSLLLDNVEYQSPLAHHSSASEFCDALDKNRDQFSTLELKKVFVDGNDVCAIYDRKSQDPKVGELTFTEWFKVTNGKIASIQSNFNAQGIIESRSQI